MLKYLLESKEATIIAYVPRNKTELFETIVRIAKKECEDCGDKKGKMAHIIGTLGRNGFKTFNLRDCKPIRV